jgi:hypothetical protein
MAHGYRPVEIVLVEIDLWPEPAGSSSMVDLLPPIKAEYEATLVSSSGTAGRPALSSPTLHREFLEFKLLPGNGLPPCAHNGSPGLPCGFRDKDRQSRWRGSAGREPGDATSLVGTRTAALNIAPKQIDEILEGTTGPTSVRAGASNRPIRRDLKRSHHGRDESSRHQETTAQFD